MNLKKRTLPKLYALRKWYFKHWTKIEEKKRIWFLKHLGVFINYVVNALLLSVPIYFFFYGEFHVKTYFWLVASLTMTIIFGEYYYIWIREKWRDDLQN